VKAWLEVGSIADLEREGRILIRIEGREIGVVRDPEGGGLHAMRNRYERMRVAVYPVRIEDGRVLVQA
jgi:nitrite reductase/ring-hydroxylating ferredoxin subunit